MATDAVPFAEWCVVELMGHRRIAGYVAEVRIAGAEFFRIDLYDSDGNTRATQIYAAGAIYCIHPTVKEVVLKLADDIGYDHGPLVQWKPPATVPALTAERFPDADQTFPDPWEVRQ